MCPQGTADAKAISKNTPPPTNPSIPLQTHPLTPSPNPTTLAQDRSHKIFSSVLLVLRQGGRATEVTMTSRSIRLIARSLSSWSRSSPHHCQGRCRGLGFYPHSCHPTVPPAAMLYGFTR